jgi:nucleoside-diphosphate-sugar epimerase
MADHAALSVLVTGADGFLGRACVRHLLRAGYRVVTTDRHGWVRHLGDLASASFCASLPEVDAVVHAAAVQYVSPDLPLLARERYFHRNNVLATHCLCQRYCGRVRKFVLIGTSMMYAQDGSGVYHPGSRMAGQGVYSRSKLAAFACVAAMKDPHALVVPCIIGGPGREGLFRAFVAMARRGVLAYPGRGKHPIAMVQVDDVATLVARVLDTDAQGVFNAAADHPLSIEQWVDVIEEELALPRVMRLRLPLAPMHLASRLSGYRLLAAEQLLMLGEPHVLATEASKALGWRPRYDCTEIVRQIARHLAGRATRPSISTPRPLTKH